MISWCLFRMCLQGDDWLKQLQRMEATNPYLMKCNPYNTTGAIQKGTCTEPEQVEYQLDLWETAACGRLIVQQCMSCDSLHDRTVQA